MPPDSFTPTQLHQRANRSRAALRSFAVSADRPTAKVHSRNAWHSATNAFAGSGIRSTRLVGVHRFCRSIAAPPTPIADKGGGGSRCDAENYNYFRDYDP